MAYDPVRQETVLFGGEDVHGSLGDTWIWDGHAWTLARTAVSPAPRDGARMVFDPALGTVLLLGGVSFHSGPGCPDPYAPMLRISSQGPGGTSGVDPCPSPTARQDMWAWDGRSWRYAGTVPNPGRIDGVAWDAHAHDLVAMSIGTDNLGTWTWDGTTWHRARSAHTIDSPEGLSLTTDDRTGQPLLLLDGLGPPCDGGAAAPAAAPGNHGQRSPGLSSSGEGMINCGVSSDGGRSYTGYVASTWTWTGAAWDQVFTSDMPYPATMTDGATSPAVLLGQTQPSQAETWTWSGSDWTRRTSSPGPPHQAALTPGAIADGPQGSVVYFAPGDPCSISPGTTALGCTIAAPPGSATWIWNGSAWARA
jgi:hypothetical protein